ncbi:MAG: translation elongation factor Ts [Tepidisphaeraceae bacterium]|jgi:elongation factor Ts
MAEITAKQVNELRGKTGLGMMECKKALTATGGDIEKAIDYFRKKGVKTSITERAATEGRVALAVSPDRKRGVIVEINCNTDFTAKSEPVAKIAAAAVAKLLANPKTILADDPAIKTELVTVSQQTGENVQIGRSVSLSTETGAIGSYLYTVAGKGKSAVLLSLIGKADDDLFRNIGMHIVAARPIAMTRQDVSPELIAREKEIAVEQAKATGKPQEIAEKIAIGKLNSFYAEKVLLDQEFVNAEVFKGPVANLLKTKGATLEKYVRLEVGQQSTVATAHTAD